MAIASAKFEAGKIFLPEQAPWLADLEAELFAFPGSRYDDQCDSISQAINDERSQNLATFIKAYGGRYATSVGGTLTGRGADLIIVDDPLNASEAYSEPVRKRVIDWYGGTLVSRLNDKETGSIIAVMQHLHEEDLAGHLSDQGVNISKGRRRLGAR